MTMRVFILSKSIALRKKCPYSELFWSAFSRIQTGCGEIWSINFIKKEFLAKVFSGEFYEISKNTFFYRTSPVAASVFSNNQPQI